MNAPISNLCLFCGSNTGTRPSYAAAAREIGRTLAARNITLVYGGGSVGLMDIAAQSALDAGGRVVGVITEQLMVREVGHSGLDELHVVASMHERKAMMSELADAFIALPGGYGTIEEVVEAVTWTQLGIHDKPVGLLDVDGYFDHLVAFLDRAVDDALLRPDSRSLLLHDDDASRLLERLRSVPTGVGPKWIDPPAP